MTTTGVVFDPSGRLLGAHTADQEWFYLTDALGTVVGVTGEDGTTLAAYQYDPFGQTTEATGPAAEVNRWRFAGAYLDATGLYKIGQRYYHPGWGRWTQSDPIHAPLDPVNWNRYAYAGNNPINYTDPTGLSSGCFFNEFFGIGRQDTPESEGTGRGSSGPSIRPTFNGKAAVQFAAGNLWSFTAKRVAAELGKRWVSRIVPYVGWGFTAFNAYKSYQKCK